MGRNGSVKITNCIELQGKLWHDIEIKGNKRTKEGEERNYLSKGSLGRFHLWIGTAFSKPAPWA